MAEFEIEEIAASSRRVEDGACGPEGASVVQPQPVSILGLDTVGVRIPGLDTYQYRCSMDG